MEATHLMLEAEIAVMQLQTKSSNQQLGTGEGDSSPVSRGTAVPRLSP